jgi:hypothetical protein
MTDDLTPRCDRCRYWHKVCDREHGNCDAVNVDYYTMPGDFCSAFLPTEVTHVSEPAANHPGV